MTVQSEMIGTHLEYKPADDNSCTVTP